MKMTFQYSNISLNEYPGEVSLVLYSPGCNMYCPYCFNKDLYNKKPISFKQVKDAVDEHRDFISAVVLTGGEPLCNPQIDKIIKYCEDSGLKIKLNTNGLRPLDRKGPYKRSHVDYLHISLKDPTYCRCIRSSKYDWMWSTDLLEYSFVYSNTLMPKVLLNKWISYLNENISDDWWRFSDKWMKPDIFTISQLQVGDCLNPQYNDCTTPTREDLLEIAPLFKHIPKEKLIIETKEFGRENILKKI